MSTRFIGLDIHKRYLVATGVNADKERIFGPRKVPMQELETWARKQLTPEDAVVVEMTTNTWEVHDTLEPLVGSVTVVHPPHVSLITRAQVKTDKKAALTLAQLHAAGLLPGIWVPDERTRELRGLLAQRRRFVSLSTRAKLRLHAVLHRHRLLPDNQRGLFSQSNRGWWQCLPLSPMQKMGVQTDLDTLVFAEEQKQLIEEVLKGYAASDPRMPLLVQLPGISLITGLTVLAAIGTIERFPQARHLVGYAGLGTRVHISGERATSGRISKAGRRDLRYAMVETAMHAARHHPHWKRINQAMLVRGKDKRTARVAIARKMLVDVWHILTEEKVDPFADPRRVACSLFALAYRLGVRNLPDGQSAKAFTRNQLDRFGIGMQLEEIPWGTKNVKLPPSKLAAPETA